MMDNKVVNDGYIKLLALSVGHIETEIVREKNTNNQEDIDAFREKYGNIKTIIIFIIHMDNCNDIVYDDYKKFAKIFTASIICVILSPIKAAKCWNGMIS